MSKKEKTQPKKKISRKKRPYPRITLEKCLVIGKKIRELNGGNPWAPDDVSKAIGIAKTRNEFVYYLGSSRDFGITNGTRTSDTIKLEPLGRDIIYAGTPEIEKENKIQAFFKIPIFKQVFDHYGGNTLPEMTYLANTLERKFDLPPEFHEEFKEVFDLNCKELDINSESVDTIENGEENPEDIEVQQIDLSSKKTQKSNKNTKRIFVAIPFSEKNPDRPIGFFKEVLSSLITPAIEKAGFEAYTANIKGSDIIHSTIINELLDADLVVADLTDHNPNVLFELGMRMALDKPIVIIKAKGTGGVFDVDNLIRYFEYNPVLWKSTIEDDIPDLASHIKAAWDSKNNGNSYMQILRKQKI